MRTVYLQKLTTAWETEGVSSYSARVHPHDDAAHGIQVFQEIENILLLTSEDNEAVRLLCKMSNEHGHIITDTTTVKNYNITIT